MNKVISKKYAALVFLIILSGLLLLLSNEQSIVLHIIAFLILSVGAMTIVNFDLFHPYCWYSLVFTLYSVSYPILYKENVITKFGYTKEVITLQWLALVTFLLVFSPLPKISLKSTEDVSQDKFKKNILEFYFKIDVKVRELYFKGKLKKYMPELLSKLNVKVRKQFTKDRIMKYITNLLWIILLISCILIAKEGYASKKEIYASGGIFIKSSFKLAIVLTIIYIFQLLNKLHCENKIDTILILKVWSGIIGLTLFSGERDLLFRLIVVTIFSLYLFKKIKNIYLLFALPFVVVLLPLSHMFKYYFLTGTINKLNIFSFRNLISEFLNGEFVSASKNLQIILNNSDWTEGLFGGSTILNDFIRIFWRTDFNHGRWFMDSFFPNNTRVEYGFSLVGVGYINFGYIGVVLVFVLIALFLKLLYKKANKNIYYMITYIYTIPLYMYAIRADLANIFSPFIKHLLLSLIFIYLMELISDFIEYKNIYKLDLEGLNKNDKK